MQSVLQIDVERLGCGVAAYGSFYSQFRTVDVNHGIVQEQGVPGGIQFKVGAQVGGDAVCQQLPVLPEEKVLVAEIYRHNGEWKFNAIGQGVTEASRLAELVRLYQ